MHRSPRAFTWCPGTLTAHSTLCSAMIKKKNPDDTIPIKHRRKAVSLLTISGTVIAINCKKHEDGK